MNARHLLSTILLAAAVLLASGSWVQACPTCSQALADGHGGDLVSGYFWSIVFMMSMPFLIVASLGIYFYLQIREARALRDGIAVQSAAGASAMIQSEAQIEKVVDDRPASAVEDESTDLGEV